ncbi:hypothetical protein [Nocardia alni]|uniref:hypothetical protein n=1 Tax=Nocardia alni TaxID=2815723 RepID=UPI0020B35880|nr:hypothetical protein [Nocardia alni]
MTEPQSARTAAQAPGRRRSLRRHHAGEGLEDTYNVPGILLCGLAVIALALFLTAAGYGIWGWAVVAAIVFVVAGVAGVVWLLAERRRMNRLLPPDAERQGH